VAAGSIGLPRLFIQPTCVVSLPNTRFYRFTAGEGNDKWGKNSKFT